MPYHKNNDGQEQSLQDLDKDPEIVRRWRPHDEDPNNSSVKHKRPNDQLGDMRSNRSRRGGHMTQPRGYGGNDLFSRPRRLLGLSDRFIRCRHYLAGSNIGAMTVAVLEDV